MSKQTTEAALFEAIPFDTIRNRNEKRLLKAMEEILGDETHEFTPKDIQDIYALALNHLPAHYAHDGTIILRPSATKEELHEVVRKCVEKVKQHAKA